jgi:hypothetical protein
VEDYCARDQGKENEQQIFPETEMMFLVVSLGKRRMELDCRDLQEDADDENSQEDQ